MTLQDFDREHVLAKLVVPANPRFKLSNNGPGREDTAATYELVDRIVATGIKPGSLVFGGDHRSIVGFEFGRRLNLHVTGLKVTSSECLKYPRYKAYQDAEIRVQEWGLQVIHRFLCEKDSHSPVWSESAEAFAKRFDGIWEEEHPEPTILLASLEAMVYVYYTKVIGIGQFQIPHDRHAWLPTAGAGIAIGKDGLAVEFDRDLNLVGAPAAV